MALQKNIAKITTGHINTHWRVDTIAIDRPNGAIEIVMGGRADAARQARLADDSRAYQLRGAAAAALGARTHLDDLRSAGHPVDSWPDEVKAVLAVETLNNAIARSSYAVVRSFRRSIPLGTQMDEDGNLTLPTGEVVTAEQVNKPSQDPTTWTVPGEFADAIDV